jgi:SAM-dependent methyltransferase
MVVVCLTAVGAFAGRRRAARAAREERRRVRAARLARRAARRSGAATSGPRASSAAGLRSEQRHWQRQAERLGADVVALPDVDIGAMSVAGSLTRNDLARYTHVLTRVTGSLLDVGCGRGIFLDAYDGEKAGVDVTRFVEPAWPLHVADAATLPFPDASWDTVSAQEMLEHQTDENVELVLGELRRVTRQRLLVTVPFCQRRLRGGHLQRFEADRLAAMFPTARFTVLDKKELVYPWILIEEDRPRVAT